MNTIQGKNLKIWREKLGYSQDILAAYLGISRTNISYYEIGDREIPIKYLEKISELFGIEPDLFFEEDMSLHEAEMAFAFRKEDNLSVGTLKNFARFKKIVRNYLMMDRKQ